MLEKLEELARLHAAVTNGEWQANGSHIYGPDPERVLVAQTLDWPTNSRDYIVAIRNAFPAILEYARVLERERDEARAQVADLRGAMSVYFSNYMQDEAASADECVCGEEKHRHAVAVMEAIARTPAQSLEAVEAAPEVGP